jgi:CBS domain-containing protein
VTIGPETPLRDVARILVERGISGLPVCDAERRVLGVVSEGDILYKEHDPAQPRRGPLGWLAYGGTTPAVVKAAALTAGEAMTAPPITIGRHRPVAEAARLMTEHRVNRLPVVKGDELVGIVTRADLVRAFTRPDEQIAQEIRRDIVRRSLWLDPATVQVAVERGAVTLAGQLEGRSDAVVLERLVARVPGVVSVRSELTWREDDTGRRPVAAAS